mgnify:CR=1 FL=1
MSLTEKISDDLINAMKSKDKVALEAIRAVKTAFILARSDKGADSVLSAEEELKIIQKQVKQRRESAVIYKEQNRQDLYEKEIAEAAYKVFSKGHIIHMEKHTANCRSSIHGREFSKVNNRNAVTYNGISVVY